ncbi:MAG: hypothetical protein LBV02_00560 [Bacteroidales bacterium]|jgi:hypothetical protein|nr:hypothetical protein [Bacteroidales bacterium]
MTNIYNLQQISENQWQARYHGNYGIYTIKLTLDDAFKVKKYSCTCPSSYSPCKHIGYVQEEIKKKEQSSQKKSRQNVVTVESVLQNVSFEELRRFVAEKAKYDTDLTQAIMLKFAEKIVKTDNEILPEKSSESSNPYSSIIADALSNIEFDTEEYYNYDEYEIDLEILGEWYEKAKDFVVQKKYDDAVLICRACIEEFAEWLDEQDDSEYDVEDFIYEDYVSDFFDLLEKITDNEPVYKKILYEYCSNELKKKKYRYTSIFNCFNDLIATLAAVNPEDFIVLQQKQLEQIEDKSSHEAAAILQRLIDFYISENQNDIAEQIVENNLQIDHFREITIEKHIENKQFAEAKKLINERLKICNNWQADKWKELLLKTAQAEKNKPEMRKISREFLENRFDKKYFTIYKSTYIDNEWMAAFEKLFRHYEMPTNQWDKGFKRNVTELLKAEKQCERLLAYFEKYPSIENLEQYYDVFADEFSGRTLSLFRKSLDFYVEKNTGRNYYEYAVKIMRKIQKIEGGQEVVNQMIANYRTLYKNRRAMMEVLGKMGENK